MTIYAIKAPNKPSNIEKVFKSLKGGEGRFGWSYIETADLYNLRNRIEQSGWDSLTEEEQECYHGFLLNFENGDYVIYINVPVWGRCTLAEVKGKYRFHYDDEDFNHRFPVDPKSVRTFDRNDAMVPPVLNARLKLQGRWWTIYTESAFKELLEALCRGTEPKPSTPETNQRYLTKEIRPLLLEITQKIHSTHPNVALEYLLADVFKKVPGVKKVEHKGGPGDHGADLLVEIECGSIPGLVQTIVVQVKSYEGEQVESSAVKDIERAFERYEVASMGLIVSTATSSSKEFERELDRLREKSKKPVAFLSGANLAKFFLHFGSDLLSWYEPRFS